MPAAIIAARCMKISRERTSSEGCGWAMGTPCDEHQQGCWRPLLLSVLPKVCANFNEARHISSPNVFRAVRSVWKTDAGFHSKKKPDLLGAGFWRRWAGVSHTRAFSPLFIGMSVLDGMKLL